MTGSEHEYLVRIMKGSEATNKVVPFLLKIVERTKCGFVGELGPGVIVGSAAFNLFVIIAICIWVSIFSL